MKPRHAFILLAFFGLALGLLLLSHFAAPKPVPAGQQVSESDVVPPTERGDGTPPIGGPFTLQSASGPVTQQNLLGHYTLLYFGYSHCPDVCPTTLALLAQVFKQLPATQQAKLRFVFISVDPERDTPQSLQAYVSGFNPGFQGWTGTTAQLTQITHEYLTYYVKRPDPTQPGQYSMDHSSIIYLVGPDGQFITNFGHADTAASIVQRITSLLAKS